MDASKGEIRFAPHGLVGAGSEAPLERHSPPALRIPSAHKQKTTQSLTEWFLVEHRGFEPLTSTMRTLRATNCANAPRMIGGFVQTSVETASRNCTARTQQEPSFHTLLAVLICKN